MEQAQKKRRRDGGFLLWSHFPNQAFWGTTGL